MSRLAYLRGILQRIYVTTSVDDGSLSRMVIEDVWNGGLRKARYIYAGLGLGS